MTSATTVDALIRKRRFERQEALAVAEAIDTAMTESQIVTVPILDARLTVLDRAGTEQLKTGKEQVRTEIQRTRAELIRWVFITLVGASAPVWARRSST